MYETLVNTIMLLPNLNIEQKQIFIKTIASIIVHHEDILYAIIEPLCKDKVTYKDYYLAHINAMDIEEDSKKTGYKILSEYNEEFPDKLRGVFAPYTILYVKGNIDSIQKNSIALFGLLDPTKIKNTIID